MRELSKEEWHMVYSALNEVCNGKEVEEFEIRMGNSEEKFKVLLDKIGNLLDELNE